MPYEFKIVDRRDNQFGVQFLYNAEIMVWSESYKAEYSALRCIESLKKNCQGAPTVDLSNDETGSGYRWEIAGSMDGQFFVRFVASNGEIMVVSEMYRAKASAKNCIESCKKNMPSADVDSSGSINEIELLRREVETNIRSNPAAALQYIASLQILIGQEISRLGDSRPNDEATINAQQKYVEFLSELSRELGAIRQLIEEETGESPDDQYYEVSTLLVQLSSFVSKWLRNHEKLIRKLGTLGLIGTAVAFLNFCGCPAPISGVVALVLFGTKEMLDHSSKK